MKQSHSSYTYYSNVYSDPAKVFDELLDIQAEIVECAGDISNYYDDPEKSLNDQLLGEGTHKVNGKTVEVDMYELKKALWLAINSVNILEGIVFTFICL